MQTLKDSLKETLTDVAIGFVINYILNFIILNAHGLPVNAGQTLSISIWFTVVAILRRLAVRRWFNRKEQ